MKIGIYPGAFDPVHDGHVAFAKAAQAAHGLDKVYFLPEPSPRYKQGVKALEHRLAMTQLAIKDEPTLGAIQLDQARFTVHETWPLLTARFEGADLYMLLGSDVAARLASWPNIGQFARSVPKFIIALRGQNTGDATAMLETLIQTKNIPLRYSLQAADYHDYNSTDIRLALKHGQAAQGLRKSVRLYITQNGLYSSGDTGEK